MKKYFGLLVCAVVITSVSQNAWAQKTTSTTKTSGPRALDGIITNAPSNPPIGSSSSACFDYYHFQSVQVSVGPEMSSYNAGDKIRFVGEIINQNSYPIVDGYVFVRIGERNPKYTLEGQLTVDEFIAIGPVSIDAASSLPVSFTWNAPQSLKNGSYKADYFFSVGKKFNLGGLPFTNEIIIGFSEFKITNGYGANIVFDRSKTLVNTERYLHVGNWPEINPGDQATVSEVLNNPTKITQKITVTYDLYWWDSLNPADKISTKIETISVRAGASTTLTYKLPTASQSVYYLKMTATTEDGQKTVDNIRILTRGIARARANYPAITQFPIAAGDTATLFSCYHNASDSSTAEGKLVVTLKDQEGNNISNLQYRGAISPSMSVAKSSFTAPKNLTYLTVEEKLYDKNNKLIESYNATYDCSTLNSKACADMLSVNWALVGGIVALCIIILLVAYILHRRNPHPDHKHLWSTVVLLVIIALGILVVAYLTRPAWAEEVSADGKMKTQTVSVNYQIFGETYGPAFIGTINNVHTLTLVGSLTPVVGDTISFTKSSEGEFNGTSGSWDSPYFGSRLVSIKDRTAGSSYYDSGYKYAIYAHTLYSSSSSVSVSSSDPSVLSCSGMSCVTKKAGPVSISVNVGPSIVTGTGDICLSSQPKLVTDCHTDGWTAYFTHSFYSVVYGPVHFYGGSTYPYDFTDLNTALRSVNATTSIIIPGYSTSWSIIVSAATATSTATGTIPLAPTNFAASTASSCGQGVNLSWTASVGAAGYKIYRGGTFLVGTTNTSYNYVTSSSGQYYVTAYNANGESSPSATVTGTPAAACPVIPGGDGNGGGSGDGNGGGATQVASTTLYIGRTITSTSTRFMAPLGNFFSLNWMIPSGYGDCRVNTTPSATWTADWLVAVSGSGNFKSDISTINNGIGKYTLSMSCSNTDHTATSTDTVELRLTDSNTSEI